MLLSKLLAMSFSEFANSYLTYIIIGIVAIVFIVIVIIAAKKKRTPTKYVPDEIDRTVDETARKKSVNNETVSSDEPSAKEDNSAAEQENEDEQEEITFEAEDVDQPVKEQKDEAQKRKTISYRILYDKETKTWEVRKDNAKRVIRRVKTKKEALEIAQELCQKQDLNLVVHKKDGKFQKIRK